MAGNSSKSESDRAPIAAASDVATYYDGVADRYFEQYQRQHLGAREKYPQNYFRLQLLTNRLALAGSTTVYEVGTGEGTPLATLARTGRAVAGCDISQKMVDQTRATLQTAGVDPARVQWADIEDSLTFANQLLLGPFDALVAFGVMPHVKKDDLVIRNMRSLVRPGGRLFIEFRNKLFSLFTFNRLTLDFIVNDLLKDASPEVKQQVGDGLRDRLAMDQPAQKAYESISPKFHNPFEVPELLEREGFGQVQLHWYHYHAVPPILEALVGRDRCWEESAKMEHRSTWRGYFLCSAFVVEAVAQ